MKITLANGMVVEGTAEELASYIAMIEDFAKAYSCDACQDDCCETVEPETITFEGAQYRKVDREAREGDVVIFRENSSCYFIVGETYKVVTNGGVVTAIDEDDDDILPVYRESHGRTRETVDVYEPIANEKPAHEDNTECTKSELKAGDFVKFAENGLDIVAGKPYEIIEDADGNLIFLDDVGEARSPNRVDRTILSSEELKWAKLGRKVNEYKPGDIIEYGQSGNYTVPAQLYVVAKIVSNQVHFYDDSHGQETEYMLSNSSSIRLIAPVESVLTY